MSGALASRQLAVLCATILIATSFTTRTDAFHDDELQVVTANARSTFEVDEFTTVTIEGDARSDAVDFRGAASLVLGTHFSWEHFNLRVGLGYGHFNLPVVNFVAGAPSLVPEFDIYWVLF